MAITLKLNYKGINDRSQFVKYTTERSLGLVLEDIGKCCATGSMYSVLDASGRLAVAIPGRRIETVEQVD